MLAMRIEECPWTLWNEAESGQSHPLGRQCRTAQADGRTDRPTRDRWGGGDGEGKSASLAIERERERPGPISMLVLVLVLGLVLGAGAGAVVLWC